MCYYVVHPPLDVQTIAHSYPHTVSPPWLLFTASHFYFLSLHSATRSLFSFFLPSTHTHSHTHTLTHSHSLSHPVKSSGQCVLIPLLITHSPPQTALLSPLLPKDSQQRPLFHQSCTTRACLHTHSHTIHSCSFSYRTTSLPQLSLHSSTLHLAISVLLLA